MRESRQELTLAQERLHWGIFIPAAIVTVALLIMTLPVLFFLKLTANLAGQFSPQAHSQSFWVVWLVLIPDVVIAALLFLVTWLAYLKSEVTLTNRRLIFRTGFVSRLSGELPLENLETIIVMEPLLGRLFGYGTVLVSGLGGTRFPLRFLPFPKRFYALLQKAVTDAKAPGTVSPTLARTPAQDDSRYMPKG